MYQLSLKKFIGKASLLLFLIGNGMTSHAQIITTIAGNGSSGGTGDGGSAVSAELAFPFSINIDKAGNLYIGDQNNNKIRKVTTAGIISTFAGTGGGGYNGDGGAANAAELDFTQGIAIDSDGNIYVGDADNYRIRKIVPSGTISTIAGDGSGGYTGDGGPASGAELNFPKGVAVDKNNNLYIADYGNHCIRKIDNSGNISTFAGTGNPGYSGDGSAANAAKLNNPQGIAVDDSGNVYIADYGNNCIRKVNTSGIISTVAGTGNPGYSGDGGAASQAQLNGPSGIAIDSAGNIFIADFFNNCIRKVSASGTISTVAGNATAGFSGDGGLATAAKLNGPSGVAVDKQGNLYIADQLNNRIRLVHTSTSKVNNLTNATQPALNIFPNPNNGNFTINISAASANAQLVLTNLLGKKVKELSLNPAKKNQIQLHIDDKGIYFLSLFTSNRVLTQKIIVE